MIGVKGVPFTETFEWVKWRRSKRALANLGADKILTDAEAKRLGYQVQAARSCAPSEPERRRAN